MKKAFVLAAGWFMTVVGGILTPIPMPLPFPFPIGITMLLVGCAILSTHSKTFRRAIQYVRHHNAWLSRGLEFVARHTSDIVEKMADRFTHRRKGRFSRACASLARNACATMRDLVERTSPLAHGRRARMRARQAGDAA
jgi:hypothetical protein